MKPASFDYVLAEYLDEALDVLANEGSDARIIAGGQSLMPMLNMRLAKPKTLVDIMQVSELARIERKAGIVTIGAAVRQAALLDWAGLGESLRLADKKQGHRLRLDRACRSERRIAAGRVRARWGSALAQRQAAAARRGKGLFHGHDGDDACG